MKKLLFGLVAAITLSACEKVSVNPIAEGSAYTGIAPAKPDVITKPDHARCWTCDFRWSEPFAGNWYNFQELVYFCNLTREQINGKIDSAFTNNLAYKSSMTCWDTQ